MHVLNARQSLVQYEHVGVNPNFLLAAGSYVDFVVTNTTTIASFAFEDVNYSFEQTASKPHAWGPFPGPGNYWLFLDLDLWSGAVTYQFTTLSFHVGGSAPASPQLGQNWFNTTTNKMYSYEGTQWVIRCRIIVATYDGAGTITYPWLQGQSQVGIYETAYSGFVLYSSAGTALRNPDYPTQFITSATNLTTNYASGISTSPISLGSAAVYANADVPIPAFSFVQFEPMTEKITIASPLRTVVPVVGMILVDLDKNYTGRIIHEGYVRNENWNFLTVEIGKPVFTDTLGAATSHPPVTGASQVLGTISGPNTILLGFGPQIILH